MIEKVLDIRVLHDQVPTKEQLFTLYDANNWSSANKIDLLHKALQNSDTLLTAFHGDQLIGVANAISDGYLVVYFPHLLIHPNYHRLGIGSKLVDALLEKYKDFHQKMIVADDKAISFYKQRGFELATGTTSMWIYEGGDH